jgi:hypothetical protein
MEFINFSLSIKPHQRRRSLNRTQSEKRSFADFPSVAGHHTRLTGRGLSF